MRERKPYWKSSHSCWYFRCRGKETRLDPDKDKAWTKWHEIVGGQREVNRETTVVELIAVFLDFSKRRHKDSTYQWYKEHLESFYQSIGKLRVSSLRPYHVTQWLEERYPNTDNGSTHHGAMRAVQRVFNWARKEGRLVASPLQGLEKPKPTARDVYLMPEQFKKLVAGIKDEPFLDFVTIMHETGCRPMEARTVEARHFDREGRCWVFPKEEAKGGREPRVVLLNDRAFAIVQRLALKYPHGPLFRNKHGEPWSRNALNSRCQRLKTRLKFHVCPYAIRHTFATDAIIRGVDLVTIAQLMGHKNLDMLTRIYQHVKKRDDHLREGLRKATEEAA
jgi:integrase